MFGAMPSTSSRRSLKRRGPSSSAPTIRRVQRSPTRESASASGDAGRRWAGVAIAIKPTPTCQLCTIDLQFASYPQQCGIGAVLMAVLEEITTSVEGLVERVGPAVVGLGRGWGRGSGVVTAPGQVLTNAHNLRGDTVTVTFADGRSE